MVQSSNPKQKYHQQRDKSEKNTSSSLVDKQHKQKAPMLVTVSETVDSPLLQPQSDLPTSHQKQESELCEEDEELGATVGDGSEDKETESVGGMRTSEGDQLIQKQTERKETELLVAADESKLEDSHQRSRSPPDTEQEQEATAQVLILYQYSSLECGTIADSLMQVESDDEEKKVLLIEENIQLLEESERVCALYAS